MLNFLLQNLLNFRLVSFWIFHFLYLIKCTKRNFGVEKPNFIFACFQPILQISQRFRIFDFERYLVFAAYATFIKIFPGKYLHF